MADNFDVQEQDCLDNSRRNFLVKSAGVIGGLTISPLVFRKNTHASPVGDPLKYGQIALSFHVAAAGIVKEMLEQDGVKLEVHEAPHKILYAEFAKKEVDMVCASWLPGSHSVYIDPIKRDVIKLGVLYEPYTLWGVPEYVPESEVKEVADLLKPQVASKMTKLIQGINPGAGISRFSQEIVKEYGLDKVGYHFEHGSQQDCFSAFEQAVKEKRWVVVPLWHPQYLHHRYKIRELVEPKGLLRSKDEATILIQSRAMGKLPQSTIEWLNRIHLGNAAVAELDYMTQVKKMSVSDAAKDWLNRHPEKVKEWRNAG